MTATTLQDRLAAAEDRVRHAASVGYDAYMAARRELVALESERAALEPARTIYVTGNTYNHRRALAALGLGWHAGLHAWTGMVRGDVVLPRGCWETTYGPAAVASMDYADSDF